MPTLTIIAGPNGSGKSTITQSVQFEGRDRLLDPDAIARELNPANLSSSAIGAAREVLRRTAEYMDQCRSFAIETTLSSRGRLDLMRNAKSRGYVVQLIFIGLDSPERCITRIRNRAIRGGHFIPDVDVRRRYLRSIALAAQAIQAADIAKVFDNSGLEAHLILVAKAGVVVWRAEPLPEWVRL